MAYAEKLPNGKWRAVWRESDGRKRSKTFRTKGEANRYGDRQEVAIEDGDYVAPAKITFAEVAEKWLARKRREVVSADSLEIRLRKNILPKWGHWQVQKIRRDHCDVWSAELSDRYSASYAAGLFVQFRAVLKEAVAQGVIPSSPADTAHAPKHRKGRHDAPPSHEAVAAVIAELPDRDQLPARIAATLGLRFGEVFGLTRADVDFDTGRLNVDKQTLTRTTIDPHTLVTTSSVGKVDRTKWQSDRKVPVLDPTLLTALAAYMLRYPPHAGTGAIFTTRHGNLMRSSTWGNIWRPACERAGHEFPFKDLRRYAASRLIREGAPVELIQEMLGHSSYQTTYDSYIGVWPEEAASDLVRYHEAAEARRRAARSG